MRQKPCYGFRSMRCPLWTWMSIGWHWQSTCVFTHRECAIKMAWAVPHLTRFAGPVLTPQGQVGLYTHILCTQMMFSVQDPWDGLSIRARPVKPVDEPGFI
jgi:hypothetical protein